MMLIIYFNCFIALSNSALIIDKLLDTCEIFKSKTVNVIRQDWIAKLGNIEVKFNLCSNLSDVTYGQHRAFVKDKTKKSIKFFVDSFDYGIDEVFGVSENCSLSVKLDCLHFSQEPTLLNVEGCNYKVLLFSPSSNCHIPCTAVYNNRLIDFRKLKKEYFVNSGHKNFSIFLCDENPKCGPGVSSCEITPTSLKSISLLNNERVSFDDKTYQVVVHGKFKDNLKSGKKIERKFELTIKCNWYNDSSEIRYKEAPILGKFYKFEMDSSLVCVKYPVCEFSDKFYKFNLINLYDPNKSVEVTNVTGSRKIYLNLCGPLNLTATDSCSSTYSQVCEVSNSSFVSRGRLYSQPTFGSDFVSILLISGDPCPEGNFYSTKINLICSRTEEKPLFVQEKSCELLIDWRTPKACPKIDNEKCRKDYAHLEPNENSYTCSYKDEDNKENYNLKRLYNRTGHHLISHHGNKNVSYLLNVCGPVFDVESPCKINSMVAMKYLDELDVRKKVKFYGQVTNVYTNNNNLIMETSGGEFCNFHDGDYKSVIKFECSNKESEIILIKTTPCTVEFLWKTKFACPNKMSCVFNLPSNNKHQLDFSNMKETALVININNDTYVFDICGNKNSTCNSPGCIYVPVNRSLVTFNNKTHLEFLIHRPCNGKHQFNKTLFELVCDPLKNNEHFEVYQIIDCVLILRLKTNRACFQEEMFVPIRVENKKKISYKVENNSRRESVNCTLKNNHTGYEYNIKQLLLNVSTLVCPEYFYNQERQIVTLIYNIPYNCRNSKGEPTNFPLEVTVELKCSNVRKNSTKLEQCSRKFKFELPEACKLLEGLANSTMGQHVSLPDRVNAGALAGYIILGLVVILGLIGTIYWWIRYRRRVQYRGILMAYEKAADD